MTGAAHVWEDGGFLHICFDPGGWEDGTGEGTWGLWGNYYDQGAGTFIAHTMKAGDWGYFTKEGFKGYGVGINYTLAKNMVYNLDYYDLEGKESGRDSQIIWNRLQVTF